MEFLLIWLICGVLAGAIATSKGRSGCGWLVLGVLFGPFAILGAAIMSPDKDTKAPRRTRAGLQDGTLRPCPFCHTAIARDASVCPACRRDITPLPPERGLVGTLSDFVESFRRP